MMDSEQLGKEQVCQNYADPAVEAVLEKCVDIYKEMHKEMEKLDENVYGSFPSSVYIEQQRTIPGKTRISSVRDTIGIWKYEGAKWYRETIVPAPVVSKMYFDRAHFVFEIKDNRVRFEYYFGPRYGRGMEFDIVKISDTMQLVNERFIWIS